MFFNDLLLPFKAQNKYIKWHSLAIRKWTESKIYHDTLRIYLYWMGLILPCGIMQNVECYNNTLQVYIIIASSGTMFWQGIKWYINLFRICQINGCNFENLSLSQDYPWQWSADITVMQTFQYFIESIMTHKLYSITNLPRWMYLTSRPKHCFLGNGTYLIIRLM